MNGTMYGMNSMGSVDPNKSNYGENLVGGVQALLNHHPIKDPKLLTNSTMNHDYYQSHYGKGH